MRRGRLRFHQATASRNNGDDRGDALDGFDPVDHAGRSLDSLEKRAVQEPLLADCPAGRDVVGDAAFGDALAKSESQQPPQHTGTSSSCAAACIAPPSQRHRIDGVAGEMPGVHGPAGAARDQPDLALTRAQALP
jgi:hypothetical protein